MSTATPENEHEEGGGRDGGPGDAGGQDEPLRALHLRVLDELGEAIVSGAYAPGQRLTLEGIQQQYGISRTLARDTTRVLESMNLVYSRRRVGIVVQDSAHWNVFDPKLVRWRLASARRTEQYASLTELGSPSNPSPRPVRPAGQARPNAVSSCRWQRIYAGSERPATWKTSLPRTLLFTSCSCIAAGTRCSMPSTGWWPRSSPAAPGSG